MCAEERFAALFAFGLIDDLNQAKPTGRGQIADAADLAFVWASDAGEAAHSCVQRRSCRAWLCATPSAWRAPGASRASFAPLAGFFRHDFFFRDALRLAAKRSHV